MRKGLARLACFLGAAQPDALLVMPASAPIFTELSCHARVVDTPHQCAVFFDLLDGWGAHKEGGGLNEALIRNRLSHGKVSGSRFRCCTLDAPIIRSRSLTCSGLRQGRRS